MAVETRGDFGKGMMAMVSQNFDLTDSSLLVMV